MGITTSTTFRFGKGRTVSSGLGVKKCKKKKFRVPPRLSFCDVFDNLVGLASL